MIRKTRSKSVKNFPFEFIDREQRNVIVSPTCYVPMAAISAFKIKRQLVENGEAFI